jgi:hypothetical protein
MQLVDFIGFGSAVGYLNSYKTVAPRSDALMPGEHFSRCPSCGNTTLVTRPAAALSSTLSTLATGLQALSSLWRR